MRRFLLKILLAAWFAPVVAVSVFVVRIALAQKNVAEAFDVPPGTEVVFIGNSHTGCTWTEASEFRNRVIWQPGVGFLFHYLRFLEMERLGFLDHGVHVCVVDLDWSSLWRFRKREITRNAIALFPIVWRYFDKIPMNEGKILFEAFLHSGYDYSFRVKVPREVPDWTTTRTRRNREEFGGQPGGAPLDWNSDAYPPDWQVRFYEMVADMKARCDKRGIRLIFFASPLASDCPDRNIPFVCQSVSSVAEKIRTMGIEYYDYRVTLPDNKFRDAGHLLPSSAYGFTKKFYEDVLKQPVGK